MSKVYPPLRKMLVGAMLLPLAVSWVLAQNDLPAPNGLLTVVATPETFTPTPATVGQTVKAIFGITIPPDNKAYQQELQTKGVESEQYVIRFEGGGGLVTAVKLTGVTLNPVTKKEQEFSAIFSDLKPGETRNDAAAGLTLKVSASGDQLTITGKQGSPFIMGVVAWGKFTTPGKKEIQLNASVKPVGAKGSAIGQARVRGVVSSTTLVRVFRLPNQVVDTAELLFERTGDLTQSLNVMYSVTVVSTGLPTGSISPGGRNFEKQLTFQPGESWHLAQLPLSLPDPQSQWNVTVRINPAAAGQYQTGVDFLATDVLRNSQPLPPPNEPEPPEPNPPQGQPAEKGVYVDKVKITTESAIFKKYEKNPVAKEMLETMINSTGLPFIYSNEDMLNKLITVRLNTVKAAIKANEVKLAFTQDVNALQDGSAFFDTETKDFNYKGEIVRSPGIKIKAGKKPTDAIDDIFVNSNKYKFDCVTMTQAIFHKAIRDTFPDRYDEVAKDLAFHSIFIDQNLRSTEKTANTPVRPGDRVPFRNPAAKNVNFQEENTIYLGGDKYFAPGLPDPKAPQDGNIHTKARVIELLDALPKQPGNTTKPTPADFVAYPLNLR